MVENSSGPVAMSAMTVHGSCVSAPFLPSRRYSSGLNCHRLGIYDRHTSYKNTILLSVRMVVCKLHCRGGNVGKFVGLGMRGAQVPPNF
jgi:hypothetical protein